MAEEVFLLKTAISPFGLRIVWALKLKGIQYVSMDEDLSNKSPLLLECNPLYKKIPVLVHNGKPIAESLIILEYIDEIWKKNPLLPEDPHKKATARLWAKFGDDKLLQSVFDVCNKKGEERQEAFVPVIENLKQLEKELKGKRFFGGEKIGLVDIVLGWLVNLVPALEEVFELKIIDGERFPLISAWIKEFSDVPIIKENLPPQDKVVAKVRACQEAAK